MSRIDRSRQFAAPGRFDRPPSIPGTFVGQVSGIGNFSGGGTYVSVHPAEIFGPEAEGGPVTITADTSKTIVVDILRGTPAIGDNLVCWHEGNRWIAEKDGAGSVPVKPPVSVPNCPCLVPQNLTMTVVGCTGGGSLGLFYSCTLTYQPTPSRYNSLGLPDHVFLSDQFFMDGHGGDQSSYQYYFYCQSNSYFLTRVYPAYYGNDGDQFRDAGLYSWNSGELANSCSPFYLHGGKPYYGPDPTCTVKMDPS